MLLIISEYKSNFSKQTTWYVLTTILVVMLLFAFPIINDPSIQPILESNFNDIPNSIKNVIFPFETSSLYNLRLYFNNLLLLVSFIVSIYGLNIGLNSLAKEQGYGTIDYLFINPITRGEIVLYKFIANLFNLLFLVILLFLSSCYAYSYIGEVDFINIMIEKSISFIVIFTQGMFFLSLGTMVSAFAKRTSSLNGVGSLIIITFLILNILISSKILYVPFKEFIPLRTLQETIDYNQSLLLVSVAISHIVPTIVFYIIGNVYYERKDLII